ARGAPQHPAQQAAHADDAERIRRVDPSGSPPHLRQARQRTTLQRRPVGPLALRSHSLRNDLETAIIELLRTRGSRLLAVRDIFERLELHDVTQEQVAIAVDELENDGVIVPVRGKRYSLLEFTPYAAGRLRVHPDGYGTIFGGGGDEPDIYVDRRGMKGAM